MGAGHDLAKGKKRAPRLVKKRKPLAEGDRVWIIGDDPQLIHGSQYEVIEAWVRAIGKSRGVKIYNCSTKERTNLLKNKDEIRPFTNRGRAELLRLLSHKVSERGHHHRSYGNALLDLVGELTIEISELEGERRGKAHRTKSRAAKRVGSVAGG